MSPRRAFLTLLLAAGCASAGGLPPAAIEHNRAGAASLAAGELDDAEARFRLALEYHPGFSESRANLGLVAFERGDLEAAEGHLRSAIRLDASFDEAWSNLGLVLVAQGRRAAAARAFEQALSIDPGLIHARRNLAELWMREGRFTEARAHLMRLVQIVSEDTDAGAHASGLLAYCEFRLGREREALYRAETVLAVAPDQPLARLVRGVARASRGELDAALDDYEVAKNHPLLRNDAELRIAAVLLVAGELEQAGEMIDELVETRADEPAVQLLAAHRAMAEADETSARRHLQAALDLSPQLPAALALLSELDP